MRRYPIFHSGSNFLTLAFLRFLGISDWVASASRAMSVGMSLNYDKYRHLLWLHP